MYDVLDVCKYIIDYCNEKKYYINQIKLFALLYFIKVICIDTDRPEMFKAELVATSLMVTCPEVENSKISYIPINIHIFPDWGMFDSYDIQELEESDKDFLNEILETFGRCSPTTLRRIIRQQDPWKKAKENTKDNTIKAKDIKEYFK